jgi:hypothetical protein
MESSLVRFTRADGTTRAFLPACHVSPAGRARVAWSIVGRRLGEMLSASSYSRGSGRTHVRAVQPGGARLVVPTQTSSLPSTTQKEKDATQHDSVRVG